MNRPRHELSTAQMLKLGGSQLAYLSSPFVFLYFPIAHLNAAFGTHTPGEANDLYLSGDIALVSAIALIATGYLLRKWSRT